MSKVDINLQIQKIQNKLSALYGRIQILHDSIPNIGNDPIKIDNFLADSFTIDNLKNDFCAAIEERNQYQLSMPESPTPNYSSLISFEQLYARIKYKIHQLTSQSASRGSMSQTDRHEGKFYPRLPCIELSYFDGETESWPGFYETFKNLIHENPELTNSEKIHYLIGRLKGNARSVCHGISPIGENYSIIWNALLAKYNDTRVQAGSYLDKIFNISVENGSSIALEKFIDQFSSTYMALKQLEIGNLEDFVFIYIASKHVGFEVVKQFELSCQNSSNYPTCMEFIEFVRRYIQILNRARSVRNLPPLGANSQRNVTYVREQGRSQNRRNIVSPRQTDKNSKTFVSTLKVEKCICCESSDHNLISQCSKFLCMTPYDRYKFVKNNKYCVNCLHSNHTINNCKNNSRCESCGRSHNSLLHFTFKRESRYCSDERNNTVTQSVPAPLALCSVDGSETTSCVLLATAKCHVLDKDGNNFVLRALVDCASQRDIITTKCCERLNLKVYDSHTTSLSGVGEITNPIVGVTSLTIRSRFNNSIKYNICPIVVNSIANLPTSKIDTTRFSHYFRDIELADNEYFTPAPIDIILGADIFARILRENKIMPTCGEPLAIETTLGYILLGSAPMLENSHKSVASFCTIEESIENRIDRFFELEEIPNTLHTFTKDEQQCVDHYNDTTRRTVNGHFVVSLPFKHDPSQLGDSVESAERRFLCLERKLLSNSIVRSEYNNVFLDYLQKNYMVPIGTIDNVRAVTDQYVIPHFGVFKPEKTSSRCRIVLDASCPTKSGKSLNDLLLTGPNLQNDLFQIILKFRLWPVAISADIRQMYLRIMVQSKDTRYQRLLYRFDPTDAIKVFEMTRVPFGLSCSPYLAIRTVRQLAADGRDRYPAAAAVAETDLFMDDLTTSCRSIAEGSELANQLIELFATGGFELVKFSSNSPEVLERIPSTHRISEVVELTPESHLKILGLHWMPVGDEFTFEVTPQERKCTKRNILSTIARLWDLMGYVAPVTLLAKLIVKSLWEENIEWDETPPSRIVSLWQQYEAELPLLNHVKLPRYIGVNNDCTVSVVGFADASVRAYGGVVYLHVYYPSENRHVFNLICAKSRCAPSKTVITLARQELCAAVILAKLMRLVINTYSVHCTIDNIYAFTDSTVALAWIHSSPTRWQTFVANRVAKIHENINPCYFYHILGKVNPADCLSRGLMPGQLIDHPLWFTGPPFCQLPTTEWPINCFDPSTVGEIPEGKVKSLVTIVPVDPTQSLVFYKIAFRVSSWSKMLRCAIYILRFIRKIPKIFDISHYEYAELAIIKELQSIYFSNEINNIQTGKKLSPALLKLNAFMHDGILRVGGRLINADLGYDSQHPILLPRKDRIVQLIIDYYHNKYMHCGPQLLMSLLRQKYWILSARNIVRYCVHKCNACFKANPRNEVPIMGDLPTFRVKETIKAFCHTGTDYCGPFQILPYRRRGVRSYKCYICLFICLVTKAVHIELASDLSTECFINALKRFIARRGPISVLYSDRGTNYIGSRTLLDRRYALLESAEYKDRFANELKENRIQWRFNPASAPHFGGIWESNIKTLKTHLARVVGRQLLTVEEMSTVLTQIEAIMNSRPLSVLSSDPSEPLALTPAHFLVMTPLKSLPASCINSEEITLVTRKVLLDQLVNSFWKRWKVEYLHTLQTRNKWKIKSKSIEVGAIVLLKTDNSAPLDWPIGVIDNIYPGQDGEIRVVDVRTKSGVYRRPVVKVFPLPNQ